MTELRELQTTIGANNAANGHHQFEQTADHDKHLYIETKLMRAVTEIAEAQEEIQKGHDFNEIYYSLSVPDSLLLEVGDREKARQSLLDHGHVAKPEGAIIEVADAVIRLIDLVEEMGGDLQAAIDLKLAYNKTRGHLHGKAH